MNKFLILGCLTVVLFSQCGNDDGNNDPALTADFDFTLSNNEIAPTTISLASKAVGAHIYNWLINDKVIGFGPTTTYDITEEHFYIVKHEVVSNSVIIRKSDTLWIYNPEFLTAESIPPENINCQSFTFRSMTFTFETAAPNGLHFDQAPIYHPEGDPDLGSEIIFSLVGLEHILLYDTDSGDESGDGIYSINVKLDTEKVNLDFQNKFYIRIDQGCITSIEAVALR